MERLPFVRPDGAARWLARALPVAWMAMIFAFSSVQSPRLADEPVLDLVVKKVGHVVLYAVLALLVAGAVSTTRWHRHAAVVALVVAAAFAISDEFHQVLTPTRWPSWVDVVIDAVGAVVGVVVFERWRRRRRRAGAR